MRQLVLLLVVVAVIIGPASAQVCQSTLRLDCPPANYPDIAAVTVRVTNCGSLIDAFGFDVVYQAAHLEFLGVEKEGTLVETWVVTEARGIGALHTRVRVGGFDPVGIGVVDHESLIVLKFRVLTSLPFDSAVVFDPDSLTDDVVGFGVADCLVPLPVRTRTWGAVKAIYE